MRAAVSKHTVEEWLQMSRASPEDGAIVDAGELDDDDADRDLDTAEMEADVEIDETEDWFASERRRMLDGEMEFISWTATPRKLHK